MNPHDTRQGRRNIGSIARRTGRPEQSPTEVVSSAGIPPSHVSTARMRATWRRPATLISPPASQGPQVLNLLGFTRTKVQILTQISALQAHFRTTSTARRTLLWEKKAGYGLSPVQQACCVGTPLLTATGGQTVALSPTRPVSKSKRHW